MNEADLRLARNTCCHCGHTLHDNPLVKDLLIAGNTASWAKEQARILADMAEDRGLPAFFRERLREISDGIETLAAIEERRK